MGVAFDEDDFSHPFTKVTGVSHQNPDGTSRQEIISRCRKGELLRIVHEPSNKFSRTGSTMMVLRANGEQIGYLSEWRAVEARERMESGIETSAIIASLTGGKENKPTRGVNIELQCRQVAVIRPAHKQAVPPPDTRLEQIQEAVAELPRKPKSGRSAWVQFIVQVDRLFKKRR